MTPESTREPIDWWRPRLAKWPRLRCDAGHWAISYWRRQNTMYWDDRSNWACLCAECQEGNDRHWADMWADYYRGCL